MGEWEFWVRIWAIIGVTVVLTAGIITTGYQISTRAFVDGGYHDCTLQGSTAAHWCK